MNATQRRLFVGGLILAGAIGGSYAYRLSLVPATHPDHDHGILNLDAGGRLLVTTREGKTRNLVGRPGKVMVVHFFSLDAVGAPQELAGVFGAQKALAGDAGVEFVLIAKAPDFKTLDAWLASQGLTAPDPASFVLDPDGETTTKLNCKRPIETMFFNPDGKLSNQARGRIDWATAAMANIEQARGGATLE